MADKKNQWYQPKGYLHITPSLNWDADKERVTAIVSNPKLVERHAFFPLLHKKIFQRRYKVIGEDPITGKSVRRHSVKKTDGEMKLSKKVRPIHYATHIDYQIYSYYSKEILQPRYEAILEKDPDLNKAIIAYRRIPIGEGKGNKGNIHFAKEVFDEIKKRGNCVAMAYDIESFFSSLDHRKLKLAWAYVLGRKSLPADHFNLYKSITRFSYIDIDQFRIDKKTRKGYNERRLAEIRKKGIHSFFESVEEFRQAIRDGEIRIQKNQFLNKETKKIQGIPQGLAISALMANIYLLDFDRAIVQKVVKEWGGVYRRYSDDIVIIVPPEKSDEVDTLVIESIKKAGVVISEEKTEVCRFEKNPGGWLDCYGRIGNRPEREDMPFCYLGFEFDGKKVLIKAKNLSKFYRRMKEDVKRKAKQIKRIQENSIEENPTVYRRKLYRAYTMKGARKKMIEVQRPQLEYNPIRDEYQYFQVRGKRKYWGNTLGYAKRATEIMGEPSILRQFRNNQKILKKAMKNRGIDY